MARRIRLDERADEPAVADRRWLALSVGIFFAALAAFGVAFWLYQATGPHPEVWALIRGLRRVARWVLPHWSYHWHPD